MAKFYTCLKCEVTTPLLDEQAEQRCNACGGTDGELWPWDRLRAKLAEGWTLHFAALDQAE